MALLLNTPAPDFNLQSKNPEGPQEIRLSDNYGKNKTVLFFFPFAFSSICEPQTCSINDDLKSYADLNAAIYGISVDSPYALEKMRASNGLKFPLLSDFNKDVSTAYDVLYEDFNGYKGVAKRSAYVIDENGVILYAQVSDDPTQLPDYEQIKSILQK